MNRFFLAVTALSLSVAPLVPSALAAPKTQSVRVQSKKSEAPSPYKVPDLKNAPKVVAPPSKGGPKTKDAYFTLHVDNRSGRYANVWVDGTYQGVISPYGDMYVTCVSGSTRVRAEDANDNYWDHTFYKTYGTYTYTLLS